MVFRRSNLQNQPTTMHIGRRQQSQLYTNDSNTGLPKTTDSLPIIPPKLLKIVRKPLPKEFLLDVHVNHVEYQENGFETLMGTLYLTTFRVIFTPDKHTEDKTAMFSGNKYIGEYDIPLASIYKMHAASNDSRSGFTSFLSENQTKSEIRAFKIITRDFRNIKFTKCSIMESNSHEVIYRNTAATNMETYVDRLKTQSRALRRSDLYPYVVLQNNSTNNLNSKPVPNYALLAMENTQHIDDDIADFSSSNDQRIKSYLIYNDWRDELYEANEQQWVVNRSKFDEQDIAQSEGPYVTFLNCHDNIGSGDLVWHWTHKSEIVQRQQNGGKTEIQKHMLITVPGIVENTPIIDPPEISMTNRNTLSSSSSTTSLPSSGFRLSDLKKIIKPLRAYNSNGPKMISSDERKRTANDLTNMKSMLADVGLRRATTDTAFASTNHLIFSQKFERFNLSKFPTDLKRLQTSYEKLIEICVINPSDNDDDKWWTRLSSSKWLKYISKTLHGAASIAKLLNFKNIQFAGSETDNSCLMSSLVQILLRPKCRTIKGFCELIVREWIIRGHKFRERFGLITIDTNGYTVQEAPIFLLFLDCVHQLIVQNPFSFEFTDYLLLELYRNICYCYHHTFIFNNINERLEAINNCPKDLLLLSSFDFSLYLYPDTCHLLKNEASTFNFRTDSLTAQQQREIRMETTVIQASLTKSQQTNRSVFYIDSTNSDRSPSEIQNVNESIIENTEQYEYNTIQSPQTFQNNFYVDWRIFNLVLWSKCYFRYDENHIPTLNEKQISSEIIDLKENIDKKCIDSNEAQIILDTYHDIGHANSWHPKALDTRV